VGTASVNGRVVKGHWIDGPYQAVASPGFLNENHLSVGSRLTLDMGGKPATVTIAGENWDDGNDAITADWQTLTVLAPGKQANTYGVQLASGASVSAYLAAVRQASPGLDPRMVDVWSALLVAALAFSGLIIAALGAFIPARSAARLTIAALLHNE
jgi:putative ABC transport system permease protein